VQGSGSPSPRPAAQQAASSDLDFGLAKFTGPDQDGRNSEISVTFGHLNLNFWTKFDQILNLQKKIYEKFPKLSRFHLANHLPVLTKMGESQTKFDFSG
jgi:hypothetical protein